MRCWRSTYGYSDMSEFTQVDQLDCVGPPLRIDKAGEYRVTVAVPKEEQLNMIDAFVCLAVKTFYMAALHFSETLTMRGVLDRLVLCVSRACRRVRVRA